MRSPVLYGILVVILVLGASILYISLDVEAGDTPAVTEEEPDADITMVTRELPTSAVPGDTVIARLHFNISDPTDVTVTETLPDGKSEEVTIRDAHEHTVQYRFTIPEDASDTVTVSGETAPDSITLTGDTDIAVLRPELEMYPADIATVLPESTDEYRRSTVDQVDTPEEAQSAATVTYTDDDERTVYAAIFEDEHGAGDHFSSVRAQDSTELHDESPVQALRVERDGTVFYGQTTRNMYIEIESDAYTAFVQDILEGLNIE